MYRHLSDPRSPKHEVVTSLTRGVRRSRQIASRVPVVKVGVMAKVVVMMKMVARLKVVVMGRLAAIAKVLVIRRLQKKCTTQ